MDSLNFYGRIEENTLKTALLKASLKGFFGLVFLYFWGGFFMAGLLLIAWGFLPYRRLKGLYDSPPYLSLTIEHLLYVEGGNVLSFPLKDLKGIDFVKGKILLNLPECIYPLNYFSEKTFKELKESLVDEEDEDLG